MAKEKVDSEQAAKAVSGPYVPGPIRMTIEDELGRNAVVELRPLTVGMVLAVDQRLAADAIKSQQGNGQLYGNLGLRNIDLLRYAMITASGNAWTEPPRFETVTVQDRKLEIIKRDWLLDQPETIVYVLVEEMSNLSSVNRQEKVKVDFT